MAPPPLDLTLELSAQARFEVVELRSRFSSAHGDVLASYPRCLYWTAHTTAGFLDRSLTVRLGPGRASTYIDLLRRMFPEGAGYAHDRLDRRTDLDPAQRAVEPRNGDSHLAFIAGGLRPCVTHPNREDEPVCFVDLDGVNEGRPRRRLTRAIGFHREAPAGQMRLRVPLSGHAIDSVNLKDPRLGIYDQLSDFVARAGVGKARLRIALGRGERDAALTVNEFETLLMKHDLAAVLRNPLRFMAEGYQNLLANPRAVPGKALGYARYDLVRVLNTGLDTLRLSGSLLEKLLARTVAVPASQMFRVRRSVNLLVAEREDGRPAPVEGVYQSPILIQWQRAPRDVRELDVTLYGLE
ncbi:MAG TPA: hypothetical protein VFV05_25145 [Methylomirabilota bacterium]|nr:hypothetical protein [Methylomirabilota bacterium]